MFLSFQFHFLHPIISFLLSLSLFFYFSFRFNDAFHKRYSKLKTLRRPLPFLLLIAESAAPAAKDVKGTYVSIHSSGFRDFLLKPELLRAIVDCGFEHPSAVQHECIPQAILGMDVICQAKSGTIHSSILPSAHA